ncbi:hypothetical protein B7R21_09430 [Subtercola boreus]|uniref:Uncharacterized protein n=1 Tax=Subtercola boreus TaxID=120213 RepID=A0A3E0VTU3_9MICO|nr:hypothetical protein [Subtercola boreus]RFA13050.1 hypothetical protein B7R21_09430 [Subtercola boreus]
MKRTAIILSAACLLVVLAACGSGAGSSTPTIGGVTVVPTSVPTTYPATVPASPLPSGAPTPAPTTKATAAPSS